MKRRKNVFQESPGQKDHSVLGVMCVVCGREFRGEIGEATRRCHDHARRDHPEERFEYAAIVQPLTLEAEKKMRRTPTSDELISQSEVNRSRPLIRLDELEEAQRLRRLARREQEEEME